MKLIADIFNECFSHWDIILPEENIKNRENGYIQKAGWLIQYCFGKDETGEYLDYYATHRMTTDSHMRIYADGREKSLPVLSTIHGTSEDPKEAKRLEDEFYKRNQEIAEMLAEKGFDKFTINMFLGVGIDKETEK